MGGCITSVEGPGVGSWVVVLVRTSPLLKVARRLDIRKSFNLLIIIVFITRLCEAALLALCPDEGS